MRSIPLYVVIPMAIITLLCGLSILKFKPKWLILKKQRYKYDMDELCKIIGNVLLMQSVLLLTCVYSYYIFLAANVIVGLKTKGRIWNDARIVKEASTCEARYMLIVLIISCLIIGVFAIVSIIGIIAIIFGL